MLDTYIVLAPVLLLPVAGLLRFVGCAAIVGFDDLAYNDIYTLTPASATLEPGGSVTFVLYKNGAPLPVPFSNDVVWTGATDGHYNAPTQVNVALDFSVIADWGTVRRTAAVHVNANVDIVITPLTVALKPNEQTQFTSNVAVTWHPPAITIDNQKCSYRADPKYTLPGGPGTPLATQDIVATVASPNARPGKATVTLYGTDARFDQVDSRVQGNWLNRDPNTSLQYYGNEGWIIAPDPNEQPPLPNLVKLPQFVQSWNTRPATLLNTSFLSPVNDPLETRALQKPGGNGRTAGTWYTSSDLDMTFDIRDWEPHQISLYCIDWNMVGRTQMFSVYDATAPNTGAPLLYAPFEVTDFQKGVYVRWWFTGSIRMTVKNTAPGANANAVISGIFFD